MINDKEEQYEALVKALQETKLQSRRDLITLIGGFVCYTTSEIMLKKQNRSEANEKFVVASEEVLKKLCNENTIARLLTDQRVVSERT